MASRKLQREIGKRQPFGTLQEEAMLNLLRTADQVQIHFTRLFREHGLTSSQYNVLRILRGEGKPLPILEIAQRTVSAYPGSPASSTCWSRPGWSVASGSPRTAA